MNNTGLLFCALLASPASAWGQPAAPPGRLVVPAADPFVNVTVNGQQLRLKVDLGASSGVILNPRAAARAQLAEQGSTRMRIGPVRLRGSRASPTFELGNARWTGRVRWFDSDFADDADGVIGPHDLPFEEVVFEGPGRASRAPFTLEARYTDDRGLFAPLKVAGKKVEVRFSLLREQSFATGAAGALLARQQGGELEGRAVHLDIAWGVLRPTRRLILRQPWTVGGLNFPSMLVRLRDYRGKSVLPTADTGAGPNEILVTGRVKGRQGAEHFLTVGLDQLRGCESIAYLRAAKQLAFRC